MKSFFRFLRPMIFLRRKAILAGVLGGNRKWLMWGGAAWVLHWLGSLFGANQTKPRYVQQINPGERLVVVHEPIGPRDKQKLTKKAAKQKRHAAKKAR